jgi:predicted HAD superfamily phosphohydrolase YqeG
MRSMKSDYFWDLDADAIRQKCILLDIDGTIAYAGGSHIHPGVHDMITKLKEHNEIVLFSNGTDKKRNYSVAEKLGIPYARSSWRKPMPQVLEAVPNPQKLPMLIVGDLFITDGLLAVFTGARYIRVRRFVSENESRLWRLTLYWADDFLVRWFVPKSLLRTHK